MISRRKHFRNAREPFAVKVAGKMLYVLTSLQDARAARENTETLSQHELTRDFIIELSATASIREAVRGNSRLRNMLGMVLRPGPESLMQPADDISDRNLNSDQCMLTLRDELIRHMEKSMQWGRLSAKYTKFIDLGEKEISLLGWCEDVTINSATRSYFNKSLLQIEPNLARILSDFDTESWTFLSNHFPRRAKSTSVAKEKGIRAFAAYFKLPRIQRAGEADFVRILEDEYRRLGLNEEDMASLMMTLYWV